MNISIMGLGYVGCVGTACLAKLGHHVTGTDIDESKVRLIEAGRPTILEKDVAELIRYGRKSGRIEATTDRERAIRESEITFIVVGTPSDENGYLNLTYVFNAAGEIGAALRKKAEEENGVIRPMHIVAVRSTVLPGTCEKVARIIQKVSGLVPGEDFTVVSNPEFLREGTAVQDFLHPPITLLGTDNKYAEETFRELYRDIPAEFVLTDIRVAEIMKYVNNTYHALKIVFANEIGNVCKKLDIDSRKVMEIFCMDRQLNISPYYFQPGFAYGGSCLPKDSRALRALAENLGVDTPVIHAIEESNESQIRNALHIIESRKKKRIGFLGISFKAGTDDVRESPVIRLASTLQQKGYEIRIYDPLVEQSRGDGTNTKLIEAKLQSLSDVLTGDLDAVCRSSDVLVISQKDKAFDAIPEKYPDRYLVDLVRQYDHVDPNVPYEGISWSMENRKDPKNSTAGHAVSV